MLSLSVKDNPDSDDEFFDNYLVQGTITLDTKKCTDIQADGATQANVGSDRQLLYNIMAGQEKEFTITAQVEDFEMDAISFQAVPMSFTIDSSSLDTSELYDKTDEIKDAAKEFDDGATDLQDGASKLKDGASELKDGVSSLKDGTDSLKDGTKEFTDKTKDIDTQVDDAIDKVTDKISGTDFTPVSFTSEENKEIGLVQFAMKTEAISVKESEEDTDTEETAEENQSFIQKLKNLLP